MQPHRCKNVISIIYPRINVNMKEAVYCSAIAAGDEKEWNFGWERYKNSNVATEKDLLLTALACSKQKWILKR